MEKTLRLTSFEQEAAENPQLTYWLSRPPEERIAEVERLRHEFQRLSGLSEGLRRTLRIIERLED